MKSYNTLYYLLFVLLIMGAFASMAQNSYGFTILGGVAIVFALAFLYQFIYKLQKNGKSHITSTIEPFCLFVLSFIFALRIFQIHFYFVEQVFALSGVILVLIYLKKMVQGINQYKNKSTRLTILMAAYYGSIILFIIAMVASTFLPWMSDYAGGTAFVLLVGFLVAGIFGRDFLVDGESHSFYKMITHLRDNSVLLLSLFFIFSLYLILTRTSILPELYSDDYPQAYFKLVNKAESGKEVKVNGKFRYEEFKARYDRFIKTNLSKK